MMSPHHWNYGAASQHHTPFRTPVSPRRLGHFPQLPLPLPPRGVWITEVPTWFPLLTGVLLMWCIGILDANLIGRAIVGNSNVQPYSIVILFFSLAYICIALDATGCLVFVALKLLRKVKTKKQFFWLLMSLSSLFTVFTSNDIVILTLTPIILYCSLAMDVEPLPYLFITFFSANLLSVVLIISNSTNIVAAGIVSMGAPEYSKYMVLVGIVIQVATAGTCYFIFRKDLEEEPLVAVPASMDPNHFLVDPDGAIIHAATLIVCLFLLVAGSAIPLVANAPLWSIAAVAGGCSLLRNAFVFLVQRRKMSVVQLEQLAVEVHSLSLPSDRLPEPHTGTPEAMTALQNGLTVILNAAADESRTLPAVKEEAVFDQISEVQMSDPTSAPTENDPTLSVTGPGQNGSNHIASAEPVIVRVHSSSPPPLDLSSDESVMGTSSTIRLRLPSPGAGPHLHHSSSSESNGSGENLSNTNGISNGTGNGADVAVAIGRPPSPLRLSVEHMSQPPIMEPHPISSIVAPTKLQSIFSSLLALPWSLAPFLLCMFVLVEVLGYHGWLGHFAEGLRSSAKDSIPIMTFLIIVLTLVLSNVLTNQPATILLASVFLDATFFGDPLADGSGGTNPMPHSVRRAAVLSLAATSNFAANLTMLGAVAGVMWQSLLGAKGVHVSFSHFLRVGAMCTVPTAVLTGLTIWMECEVF
jgi:Na+/H+ antiporter NhaD/arsenite permease-like protein